LADLLAAAGRLDVTTIVDRCAHEPGDPEFDGISAPLPRGYGGRKRIFAGLPGLPRTEIAFDATAEPGARLTEGHHYVVRQAGLRSLLKLLAGWSAKRGAVQ
jgi:hypothetical protein